MSPKNHSLIVGLAAPGLLWLATSVAIGQSVPAPRVPSQAPTYAALLLSNGKVVLGDIVEDAKAGVYRIRASGGPLAFPKNMVQKAGGSIEELYEFLAARLPVGDIGEKMKLARWCLTENLTDQAKEQLLAMQAACPDDAEVRRMLYNLAATSSAPGRMDPAVRQTSGEVPAPLDPRVLGKVRGSFGGAAPVIFDLPTAQAVRRAGEFTEYVQPVLQMSCARCHNERYEGSFQLVEIKNAKDRKNPDIARANLDATLRLINPDDPSRSELLSSGLLPHGGSKNAVFRGPNDRYFQVLNTWVKRIRPASSSASRTSADPVSRTGYAPAEPSSDDGFASDREGRIPVSRSAVPRPLPGLDILEAARAANPPPPAPRTVNQYEENADLSGYPDSEFPIPVGAGGLPPIPAPPAGNPATPAKAPARLPAAQPDVLPLSPERVVIEANADPNQLPGMEKPLYPTAAATKAPGKKSQPKIKGADLEKLLKARNAQP
ncbi:hypothetical protein P12x_003362 [Tundrisphaera lichenicola]|uniref:hypothetical protein n=1 Tax=Tundrisphaera lichenicola TaxID=2029860 RepID=UPI003EBBBEFC